MGLLAYHCGRQEQRRSPTVHKLGYGPSSSFLRRNEGLAAVESSVLVEDVILGPTTALGLR